MSFHKDDDGGREAPFFMVNVCYELEGSRRCATLYRKDALKLRKDIEEQGGTVYWFDPVG